MAISKEEVQHIAHLARLGLTPEEITHFQTLLEGLLSYIDQLKKLDVSTIAPMAHVLDIQNVYRPDVVKPSLESNKILDGAPAREGQFFKVPKVIEG